MPHGCYSPAQMLTGPWALFFRYGNIRSVDSKPKVAFLCTSVHEFSSVTLDQSRTQQPTSKVDQGSKVRPSVWHSPKPSCPKHLRALSSLPLSLPAVPPCCQIYSFDSPYACAWCPPSRKIDREVFSGHRESRFLCDCRAIRTWIPPGICEEFALFYYHYECPWSILCPLFPAASVTQLEICRWDMIGILATCNFVSSNMRTDYYGAPCWLCCSLFKIIPVLLHRRVPDRTWDMYI